MVDTFFVHSPKTINMSNMTSSIPVDDSRWSQMAARVTDRSGAVYANAVVGV
jgi:hypothetical protein